MGINIGKIVKAQEEYERLGKAIKELRDFRHEACQLYGKMAPHDESALCCKIDAIISAEITSAMVKRDSLEVS